MGYRLFFNEIIHGIGQRLRGATGGSSGNPPAAGQGVPASPGQSPVQNNGNKDPQEQKALTLQMIRTNLRGVIELLLNLTGKLWEHGLKPFLYKTMPKIIGFILPKAINLLWGVIKYIVPAVGNLLMRNPITSIVSVIVLWIVWSFYARFHAFSDYISRTMHTFRDGVAGIGHGLSRGASAVAHGLGAGTRALSDGVAGIGHGLSHGASAVAHGLGAGARALGHGAVGIGHGLSHGASAVAHGVSSGILGF